MRLATNQARRLLSPPASTPIPGVDPRRNLHGISFAVAHVTGFLARAMSLSPVKTVDAAVQRLEVFALALDDAFAA